MGSSLLKALGLSYFAARFFGSLFYASVLHVVCYSSDLLLALNRVLDPLGKQSDKLYFCIAF